MQIKRLMLLNKERKKEKERTINKFKKSILFVKDYFCKFEKQKYIRILSQNSKYHQ